VIPLEIVMPGKMPPIGASVESAKRMEKLNLAEEKAMGLPAKPKAPAKAPTKAPAKVLSSSGTGYGSFKK
jgi:hypothetical protein